MQGNIITNVWENLHRCKHKTNSNKLENGQIKTNAKHDTKFKTLNIGNTPHTQQKDSNNTDDIGNSTNDSKEVLRLQYQSSEHWRWTQVNSVRNVFQRKNT